LSRCKINILEQQIKMTCYTKCTKIKIS